jgi:hypothetical protein
MRMDELSDAPHLCRRQDLFNVSDDGAERDRARETGPTQIESRFGRRRSGE